jgi:glutaredoxin
LRSIVADTNRTAGESRHLSPATRAVSGNGTVPQVFVGGRLIGGADDLEAHFAQGQRKAA